MPPDPESDAVQGRLVELFPGASAQRSQGDGWKVTTPHGYIDYRPTPDGNEIWWVESHRRGHGSELVNLMQSLHPADTINWGVTTPEGKGLRDKWHAANPHVDQINGVMEGQFDPSGDNYGEGGDEFEEGFDEDFDDLEDDSMNYAATPPTKYIDPALSAEIEALRVQIARLERLGFDSTNAHIRLRDLLLLAGVPLDVLGQLSGLRYEDEVPAMYSGEFESLRAAIRQQPGEHLHRLALTDWLHENGRSEEAAFAADTRRPIGFTSDGRVGPGYYFQLSEAAQEYLYEARHHAAGPGLAVAEATFHPDAVASAHHAVRDFRDAVEEYYDEYNPMLPRGLHVTRNNPGENFGGYDEAFLPHVATALAQAASGMGPHTFHVGDDGMMHSSLDAPQDPPPDFSSPPPPNPPDSSPDDQYPPTNYAAEDVESFRQQLNSPEHNATRWGHPEGDHNLRAVAADAFQEAGDEESAHHLRSGGHIVHHDGRYVPGRFNLDHVVGGHIAPIYHNNVEWGGEDFAPPDIEDVSGHPVDPQFHAGGGDPNNVDELPEYSHYPYGTHRVAINADYGPHMHMHATEVPEFLASMIDDVVGAGDALDPHAVQHEILMDELRNTPVEEPSPPDNSVPAHLRRIAGEFANSPWHALDEIARGRKLTPDIVSRALQEIEESRQIPGWDGPDYDEDRALLDQLYGYLRPFGGSNQYSQDADGQPLPYAGFTLGPGAPGGQTPSGNALTMYGPEDVESFRQQLNSPEHNATRWGHPEGDHNLRAVAADAFQEAGDEESAHHLRSGGHIVHHEGRYVPGRFDTSRLLADHLLPIRDHVETWGGTVPPWIVPEDVGGQEIDHEWHDEALGDDPPPEGTHYPAGTVRFADDDGMSMYRHAAEAPRFMARTIGDYLGVYGGEDDQLDSMLEALRNAQVEFPVLGGSQYSQDADGQPLPYAGFTLGPGAPGGRTPAGNELTRHDVQDDQGNPVGDVQLYPSGNTLHVHWAGASGMASGEGRGEKQPIGPSHLRNLMGAVADAYPEALLMSYTPAAGRLAAGRKRYVDLDRVRGREPEHYAKPRKYNRAPKGGAEVHIPKKYRGGQFVPAHYAPPPEEVPVAPEDAQDGTGRPVVTQDPDSKWKPYAVQDASGRPLKYAPEDEYPSDSQDESGGGLPPMSGDTGFHLLQNLQANPQDENHRLVTADWLEENGRPDEARRLRETHIPVSVRNGTVFRATPDELGWHNHPSVVFHEPTNQQVGLWELGGPLGEWVRNNIGLLATEQYDHFASYPGNLTVNKDTGRVSLHRHQGQMPPVATAEDIVPALMRIAESRSTYRNEDRTREKIDFFTEHGLPVPESAVSELRQLVAARKKAEAEERAWGPVQKKLPGLPRGFVSSEQRDLRGTPPPGAIWTRPVYKKGKWYRPAAEKRGRAMTLKEVKAHLAELRKRVEPS